MRHREGHRAEARVRLIGPVEVARSLRYDAIRPPALVTVVSMRPYAEPYYNGHHCRVRCRARTSQGRVMNWD